MALTLTLLLAGCGGDPAPAPAAPPAPEGPFGQAKLLFEAAGGPVVIDVEVAETPETRQQGLMGRKALDPDRGMVFLPDAPGRQSFWMKNTLIPLSVAWWDEAGAIVAIQDMEPCAADPCDTYDPGVDSAGAVEVNLGFFEERGIQVGDTVRLER